MSYKEETIRLVPCMLIRLCDVIDMSQPAESLNKATGKPGKVC